jgi:hypothetical protein
MVRAERGNGSVIDQAEFAKVMGLLAAAFPRFSLTKATVEAYYQILCDLDLDLLKAAALQLAGGDSPWFPSAGQIRAAAFRMIEEKRGDKTAGEAWGEVMAAVGRYGWYRMPEFSEPLIKDAVVAVGGWQLVCSTPIDALHTTRARFIQAYEQLQNRQRGQERMLPAVCEVVKRLGVSNVPRLGNGHDNA